MQIFDRLSMLLRANVNAAIDAAEDPAKTLDQLIRDAESVRASAQQQLLTAIAERNRLAAEAEHEETQATRASTLAERAVRSGDDERARAALRRRHDAAEAASLYTQQVDASQLMVDRLKTQLAQVDAKLRQMRQQRNALVARQRMADAQFAMATSMQRLNGHGLERELTRMGRAVRVREARADAATEVAAWTLDGRLDDDDDDHIESQLLALKQRSGQLESPATLALSDPVLETVLDDHDDDHRL